MRKSKNSYRKVAAVFAVALSVLVVSGSGAGAATTTTRVRGAAKSQAISVKVTLPSSAQLKTVLKGLGVDASAIPETKGITVEQVISLNSADVDPSSGAKGFAAALAGYADIAGLARPELNRSVSSSCASASCASREETAVLRKNLLEEAIPGGIGIIEIAGAESESSSNTSSINRTALARLNINLAKLIGPNAPLAAVGEALASLTTTVNNTVLPAVNPVLANVENTLIGALPAAVRQEIDPIVTLGTINPIPDLRTVDLIDLTVLAGRADITPKKTSGGVDLLTASSESKVTDVKILGNWATIGSVFAKATAHGPLKTTEEDLGTITFRRGTTPALPASGADAKKYADYQEKAKQFITKLPAELLDGKPVLDVQNINLGGLVGVKLTAEDILDLNNVAKIRRILDGAIPANDAKTQVMNAFDLIARTSGITVDRVRGGLQKDFNVAMSGGDRSQADAQFLVKAVSDTLRIRVEPKIPVGLKNVDLTKGIPVLQDSDFVSTGISVEVTLPNADASVAQGKVLGVEFARTGVTTPFMAAFFLIGAAILVRRFALSSAK
ncbi:MAG TPA: hypothetical protein VM600_04580 [Actinomycetota bacterium]|nr:hypothetical protein [Actinomycetota bacterium]